jgi:hypothetical protein
VRMNLYKTTVLVVVLLGSSGLSQNRAPDARSLIADAMSAAPPYISRDATIMDWEMRTLRKGSTRWTCMPSRPGAPSPNPMCADPVTMQFLLDLKAGRLSTIEHVGVSYMLRGETGADFTDVRATRPPQGKGWFRAGPHVMFVFPPSAATLFEGIPQDPSTGEPYIRAMPDGNAPLLVVPVAKPGGEIAIK